MTFLNTTCQNLIKPFLYQYGRYSLSYAQTQPDMDVFVSEYGVLTYKSWCNQKLVLSNPLIKDSKSNQFLDEWMSLNNQSSFYFIDSDMAMILKKRGYYVNQVGWDHWLNLKHSFTWKTHKCLRRQVRRAFCLGFSIKEISYSDLDPFQVKAVHYKWVASRKNKNPFQSFLTQPLLKRYDQDVRCFVCMKNEKLIAFRLFFPLYNDYFIEGYSADLNRSLDVDYSVDYALMYQAIQTFKAERKWLLSLGASPHFEPSVCNDIKWVDFCLKAMYSYGNVFYSFKGIESYKNRYHTQRKPLFVAFSSNFPIISLVSVFFRSFFCQNVNRSLSVS